MSYWSTILLSFAPADCAYKRYGYDDTLAESPPDPIGCLNVYLFNEHSTVLARILRDSSIFAAEDLNHFNVDAFLSLLRMLPWDYPDEVELFVKSESQEHFTVYRIEQPSLEDLRRQRMARENRIFPQDIQEPV